MPCTERYIENGVMRERPCTPRGGEAASASPGLLAKAINFAASAAAHVAAGMPRASQDEIERRFAICKSCDRFDGRACTLCGCPIKREGKMISKLAWANESCPVGKWGPVDTN